MKNIYVMSLAGLLALIGTVVGITAYFGLPIWLTLIGIGMVSFGCLMLLADMSRPNGGPPDTKTMVQLFVLFLPVMPVLLPILLILFMVLFVKQKLLRR
ncbi:hypothetical protein [Actimicrobium antarcticum]|uniref:Uncharacterized protein n=1 Tax=Actimicrobium antarcticum TaxID=1051899 RepID=A0ABP7TSA1_9BURK